jgi:hypothetical protein
MMITCPFCQATHVANTIFCTECGHYLLKQDTQGTESLKPGDIDYDNFVQISRKKSASPPVEPTQPVTLQFMITQQQRRVNATLEREIIIGRMDAASTAFPTVDLSSSGPMAKSVSRRHARIIKRDCEIVLEDLGSVNGTFINGKKLTSFLPVTLNSGDNVNFGKISLEVTIKRKP